MKEFIYENLKSLELDFCDKIIELFETMKEDQYKGVCSNGVSTKINNNIKNTIDLHVDFINNKNINEKWSNMINILKNELIKNIAIYQSNLKSNEFFFEFIHNKLSIETFLIHKYLKNEGKFTYHQDFLHDQTNDKYRILNYLWYLNDVEIGGETEFFGLYKIKPQKGKLVLFPSEWFFPHTGKIPISNDKYVISGWIYVDL